jgi:3',5'-cyclic AMP phosphodiesterase CpdA
MRTIVHLSDLHFGRVDAALLAPLRERVSALSPDVVVVSGDLTQRAKPGEFREARAYLDTLPAPKIVVPGNHDVPLYNVFHRFLTPLHKYRRYVSETLEPAYLDGEIAVVGINTARSFVFKGGRIDARQVEAVRLSLCTLPADVTKIVVSHHPFDLPEHMEERHVVRRAHEAMRMFSRCGADILLAGHVHMSHAGATTASEALDGYSALIVQAGTATSTRGRGETNAFNVLRVARGEVAVERHAWDDSAGGFALERVQRFSRGDTGWGVAAPLAEAGRQTKRSVP